MKNIFVPKKKVQNDKISSSMVEALFCNIDDRSIVYRSVSDLFSVCTYFLVDQKKVLIVDPGRLSEDVYRWLELYKNYKKIIYLTHEHFDHHYDVNTLSLFSNTVIYLHSDALKNALSNTRTNLSHYYNIPFETYCSQTTDTCFFEVIETPGHSKLSVCYLYDNILFGGDTIINKEYLVLKLPGGNKLDYKESVTKVKSILPKNTIVLPGHGNLFCFDSWILSDHLAISE